MKTTAMVGVLGLVLLVGCQDNLRSTASGAASNMPARPQATASTGMEASGEASGLEGKWLSPSCGERAYARYIVFEAGGRFTAEDRVAPCPQGAQCVWSGVVYRSGTYSVEGESVHLKLENAPVTSPGAAFPERLKLAPGPVEVARSDAGDSIFCEYVKR